MKIHYIDCQYSLHRLIFLAKSSRMKIINICKHCLLVAIFSISTCVYGQTDSALGDNECYVIVGAFKLEKNAVAFANSLGSQGYEGKQKYNSDRQLYYVYTYNSIDREDVKKNLFEIRDKHTDMADSWLYAGNFNGPHITSEAWTAMLAKPEDTELAETTEEVILETESEEEVAIQLPETIEEEPLEPGTFKVYLNTINAKNQREISGKFKVLDLERNKEISPIESHELVRVKPNNGTNRVKFVSNIFGYKIDEHTIDLDEPLEDSDSRVEVIGDTILLDFELAKYKKGEFAVLWQVFFFKDAAIMREESVFELNQLLQMMQEDEKMKIRIHGHTNGKSHGKVLHLDLDDKEFFSLNGSHNEDVASAKKLSEYRAYTIQHWLMDQGIPEARMEILGWGGKKMLHDKHDDKAHQNVRVEIEVLETS